MFDIVNKILSQVFLYGFLFNLEKTGDAPKLSIKIQDLLIKDDDSEGIIIEEMSVSLVDFKYDGTDVGESLKKASVIVEKFNVMISSGWFNNVIEKVGKPELEKFGVKNLSVEFYGGFMTIKGDYHKGIHLAFQADVAFDVSGGNLMVIPDRVITGNVMSIPKILIKMGLNIARNYIQSSEMLKNALEINENFILIRHGELIPCNCYFEVRNVAVENRFLVIQGGADVRQCLKLIGEKKNPAPEVPPEPADECGHPAGLIANV